MDEKKSAADLVASLCLDPGFVLVPQDRYEELIRAETERDVLEHTISGKNSFEAKDVLAAIRKARRMGDSPAQHEPEAGETDAQ